ncbi:Histone deacetylase 1 [Cucumispora dikerogammari]|nr:Histone deacetylase 1 [Cucumispora dikerogammari]
MQINKIKPLTTYIICPQAALFSYSPFHPMKPIRIAMANHILSQVPHNLNILEVTEKDVNRFFEKPNNFIGENLLYKFKDNYQYSNGDLNNPSLFNDDSPFFDGCEEFIKLYTSTSLCTGELAGIKNRRRTCGCFVDSVCLCGDVETRVSIENYKVPNSDKKKILDDVTETVTQKGIDMVGERTKLKEKFDKNAFLLNFKQKMEHRKFKKQLMQQRFILHKQSPFYYQVPSKKYSVEFVDKIFGEKFTKTLFSSNYKEKKLEIIKKIRSSEIRDSYLSTKPEYNSMIHDVSDLLVNVKHTNEYTSPQTTEKLLINYSGGLHHGRKNNFEGFCYVNDVIHLINLLLSSHTRVLYVDIDIHHGDGVEEAFRYNSNVHTFSTHRYGDFFPYTGSLVSNTSSTTNVPLLRGVSDTHYLYVFEPILKNILDSFDPSICVIQCGGDSLAEDLLGDFNLTMKGHRRIIWKVLDEFYNRNPDGKCILLGGGGYTPKNVARTWAYETLFLSRYVDCKFSYKSDLNKYSGDWGEFERVVDGEIKDFRVDLFGEEIPIIKKLKAGASNENKKAYLDGVLSYVLEVLDKRV